MECELEDAYSDSGSVFSARLSGRTFVSVEDLKALCDKWVYVANQLKDLLTYLSINTEAQRKIIKKYAKADLPAVKQRPGLTTLEFAHPSLPGGLIEQGSFLPSSIVKVMDEMKDHLELVHASEAIRNAQARLEQMEPKVKDSAFLHKPIQTLGNSIKSMKDLSGLIASIAKAELDAQSNLAVIRAMPHVFEQQVRCACASLHPSTPSTYPSTITY